MEFEIKRKSFNLKKKLQNGGLQKYEGNIKKNNIEKELIKIVDYVMYLETDKNKIKYTEEQKYLSDKVIIEKLKLIFSANELKNIEEIIPFNVVKDIINYNYNNDETQKIIIDELKKHTIHNENKKNSLELMEKNKNILNTDIKSNNYNIDNDKILEFINLAYNMFLLIEKSDIYRFIENCNLIILKLNKLSEKNKLHVICPGDSPYKIIKYIEILNLCPNCIFINFPLSRGNYNDNTFENIQSYFPDDLCNIIIIDLIDKGLTLSLIYNSLKYKLNTNKKINTDENKLCLYNIGICFTNSILKMNPNFKNYISKELKINYGVFQIIDEEYINNKYLINILNYWNWEYAGMLAWAEDYNARCIIKNSEHKKIEKNFNKVFDSFGCDFFIYLMVICYKNYDFIKKLNFDNFYN